MKIYRITFRIHVLSLLAGFLLVAVLGDAILSARGLAWDFLGYTHIESEQDHATIQVTRHDCGFRAIQLRVSGEPVFLDRVVVHFRNKTSQELIVGGRIRGNYLIDLRDKPRVIETVELWYYTEHWSRHPRVTLYGIRPPDPEAEAGGPQIGLPEPGEGSHADSRLRD